MLNKDNQIKLQYSQNFLYSKKLVSDLIGQSNICKDDIVIEIGGGRGIITEQLVKKCKKVYVIEYDFNLYKSLKDKFYDIKNVEIIHGDFLEFELPKEYRYKIFSNIPYNITSAILSKLIFADNPPDDIYIILQKEAAEKYAGKPYDGESMRSLLLKPYFDFEIIRNLKRTDFNPVTSVDSVFLQIKKRENRLIRKDKGNLYSDFIAYIFSNTGKDMKLRCKHIFSYKQIKRLSNDIGFKMTDSPTCLSYEQWLKVFQYFVIGVSDEKKKLVNNSYSKLMKEQDKIDKLYRSR
ncbi:23S ribosomal RNA methyltransferase Erm [Tissierella pigra]|uniref:rRNA adenine N-6-methyltransferase n=1 Tax=Tissierella pigra TaxID=2607614 RepID=A0A6N7XXF0_9FIRM|nr:23S ribosomal RNA methyltransferase Erm [Tissierella pigra]MBU5426259.1 23S ribosomal RNA methyltransferase Erm [Tissierella pigra]MSU01244.1 23S ribosomal RNA methyltransferase Erm [Tissierella pigra]